MFDSIAFIKKISTIFHDSEHTHIFALMQINKCIDTKTQ